MVLVFNTIGVYIPTWWE